MRHKNISKGIIMIFLILVTFSCSENKLEVPNSEAYSKVYFKDALEDPVEYTFTMKDEWVKIKFGAGYGGVDFQDRDLTINIEVENSLVEEYNETNGTDYPTLPEDSYRLDSKILIVPAGESHSNSISIEINPTHLTGPRPHLLPISIKDVSGGVKVNEKLKTVFYEVTGTYEENPFENFSQENWTVYNFSSDENDGLGGRAHHAFDEDPNTIWHSQWRRDEDGNRPGHPHFIAIDLNNTKLIHGLEIFGRKDQIGGNGNPRDIVVELSNNGDDWIKTSNYTLDNIASNTIYFPKAMNARYVKLTVNASYQDVYRTHIAEIEIF